MSKRVRQEKDCRENKARSVCVQETVSLTAAEAMHQVTTAEDHCQVAIAEAEAMLQEDRRQVAIAEAEAMLQEDRRQVAIAEAEARHRLQDNMANAAAARLQAAMAAPGLPVVNRFCWVRNGFISLDDGREFEFTDRDSVRQVFGAKARLLSWNHVEVKGHVLIPRSFRTGRFLELPSAVRDQTGGFVVQLFAIMDD
jgi:hypothetical protein